MTNLITRNKIYEVESAMQKMPQVDLKITEYFSHGVYGRALHIPKGVMLTGRIHKFDNLNVLTQGKMMVSTDEGMKTVSSGFTVLSPAGTKRIAVALEDCIWLTIIGTELKDGDTIEQEFTVASEQEYLAFCDTLKMIGE